MKVKAERPFDDLKEGVRRKVGDEFEISQERYGQIRPFVKELKQPTETKEEKQASNRQTK